ncbi:ABC transporter substrate-binding protein [Desulfosoma sp.]
MTLWGLTGLLILWTLAWIGPVAAGSVEVVDFRGKTVLLKEPARRIVCLIESALSGLYMLGAADGVVGVSSNIYEGSVRPYYEALDFRIRSKSLPAPGNWDFINVESVVALKPDLVILWAHQTEAIQALENRGIAVFGVFVERFADVHREIEAFGVLTGTEERSRELIRAVAQERQWVDERLQSGTARERPKVYFMWAQGDLETSGENSTVDELIELAGGVNAFKHMPQEHVTVHWESVLKADPDVIVMWVNAARDPLHILSDVRWRLVKAVKNKRVHELPDVFTSDLWTLKYPMAVLTLARWLHPQAFHGEDLKGRRRAFLQRLYNSAAVARVADHVPLD